MPECQVCGETGDGVAVVGVRCTECLEKRPVAICPDCHDYNICDDCTDRILVRLGILDDAEAMHA